MKINAKKVIYASVIPTALILGLVLSVWFYRTDALAGLKDSKEKLLFLPLTEQRHAFDSSISTGLNVLEKYAANLSNESPTNFDVIITKINDSAKSMGFSLVTIVGKDGILRTADGDTDISSLDCWKSAVDGCPMLERTDLDQELRFAFAVPYEVHGENQGALIGFCTDEALSAMFSQHSALGVEAFVIFEPSGQIISVSGQSGQFRVNNNIYITLRQLAAHDKIVDVDAEAMASTVASSGEGMISAGKDYSTYYSYQPLETGNWYILAAVDGAYLSAELAAEKRLGPYSLLLVGIFALFLFGFFLYITHKRLAEMDKERARYIRASTIDPLTGLYNKPGFEEAVDKALGTLPADRVCVIVAFEVVSFRTYKELYGNEAGEALLRNIAEIISGSQKSGDATARFYSDHFVWFSSGKDEGEIFATFRAATKSTRNHEPPFFLCGGIFSHQRQKPKSR